MHFLAKSSLTTECCAIEMLPGEIVDMIEQRHKSRRPPDCNLPEGAIALPVKCASKRSKLLDCQQ